MLFLLAVGQFSGLSDKYSKPMLVYVF
jgi:hypothetical protein